MTTFEKIEIFAYGSPHLNPPLWICPISRKCPRGTKWHSLVLWSRDPVEIISSKKFHVYTTFRYTLMAPGLVYRPHISSSSASAGYGILYIMLYIHFQRERDPRSFGLVLKSKHVVYVVIKKTNRNTNNHSVFWIFVMNIRMEVLSLPE